MAEKLLSWLDDLLLHASSITQLLEHLRRFLTICRECNLKLHPGKCVLFAAEVCWCGRLISSAGSKFDLRRIQGLLDKPSPATGADLQQFTCAINWMRTAIPSFSTLTAPLRNLLECVYSLTGGKRTKTAVARIILSSAGWNDMHTGAFKSCQNALSQAATLAHPSRDKRVCLYTDASQEFWSAIATQDPHGDRNSPRENQRHEPLAFLSGSMIGARYAQRLSEALRTPISRLQSQ
jgi:RNase H-like domain found in reverse transcriptase